jgi:galactose mutarotase-like enzyme
MELLNNGNQKVMIDKGELVSYQVSGYELMHQKGSPGWGHTDTEMFPIIGPTEKAGFRVHVPKGNAIQDQHGLLRELDYKLLEQEEHSATYLKAYSAGSLVQNSKFPERSTARQLIWPYSFEFKKSFILTSNSLKVRFTVGGERDMPFMIGYHPAFQLRSDKAVVKSSSASFSLEEIMSAGNRAVEIAGTDTLVLEDEKTIQLRSGGFGHFMLWSPVASMICLEPISYYPYSADQTQLHDGFMYLGEEEAVFEVEITSS